MVALLSIYLTICLSLLKNLSPESGVKRVVYFCLKSMYSFLKILFCKIVNIEFSCTRRQSRIFDPSHWYWRLATVTGRQALFRAVTVIWEKTPIFKKTLLRQVWTLIRDFRSPVRDIRSLLLAKHCSALYETSGHQYPWLVTGVFFHMYNL